MAELTSVDYLAQRLYEAGCRYAFGMPGGEVVALIDALDRAGLKFILTRHENSAGFIAEGIYHRTGTPAILVATLGPGVANAINVVANADQDRVPLLFLTGCVDTDDSFTYTHQVFDHQKLLEPITKKSFRLTSKMADVIADKAVSIALGDRPGPVHIDVPISVATEVPEIERRVRRVPSAPVTPAEGMDLDKARNWLEGAVRPVVIAGLDVLNHDASTALQSFVEHINAPLITTYKAKGVIPEDHALSLGGAGLSPLADKYLLPLIKEADVILCVGYDPIEMRTGWRNIWDPADQNVIDMSAVANEHYMHQGGINFVCNIKAGLEAIHSGLSPKAGWPNREVDLVRSELRDAFKVEGDWDAAVAISVVRENLPRDTIATADSGAHRILQSQLWECYEPRTLLQSSGLCTMGCAMPLAIGAKIAEPDRHVVAFTGDAGLLMVLGELATLAELKIPVIIVVFVDASLALIELKQRGGGFPNLGVDFDRVDFKAVTDSLGGKGFCVSSRSDLEDAISQAKQADNFSVIACEIDRQSYNGKF